jgi:hypothetical protein
MAKVNHKVATNTNKNRKGNGLQAENSRGINVVHDVG